MVFIQNVDSQGAMWYADSGFLCENSMFLGIKLILQSKIGDRQGVL